MTVKFLYLDDEPSKAKGIIKPIEHNTVLEFDVKAPITWNDQKAKLIGEKSINDYDGVLLDLKLEFSSDNSNDVRFSGAELAQTLRSEVKSNPSIIDCPIFLCTTDDLLRKYLDRTSYDLFDLKFSKLEIEENKEIIKEEFLSFASAYKTINSTRKLDEIIRRDIKDRSELEILNIELSKLDTTHEIVYLLSRYFINSPGILVDEDLMAIRLGVDKNKSKGWESLKESFLINYKYHGVLSECYERWWMEDLDEVFKTKFGKGLKVLNSTERVEKLRSLKFTDELIELEIPENQDFGTFWYKCKLSGNPLDPSDGLRTIEMPRYSWQEPTYLSLSYLISEENNREETLKWLGPIEREIYESFD